MKFETGENLRKKELKQKIEKDEANFFEKYEDVNKQEVSELLEKRKKDQENFEEKETKRKRRLKEAEKKGIIFLKDIR